MFCRNVVWIAIGFLSSMTLCFASDLPSLNPWVETIQFGYSGAGGNSNTSNLVGKFTAIYNKEKWINTYKIDALSSSSNGATSAEHYGSSAEFNYNFKPQFFSFLRGSSIYDRFNSYDLTTIMAAGLGKRLFDNDIVSIDAQIGPGYRSTRVAGTHTYYNGAIAFISTGFDWEVSDDASFQENLSVETGEINTATMSQTALSTTISGNLDLQLAFSIVHNSSIPITATLTDKTDYRTDVTLLYSFA